eukprot:TRINITY_DN10666_c0_g1_i1.p1 TRINITY_DN10666_c0_g1~~TRINITY_DN10666_c0_g1_i1.p1  ORF type:complete len:118 (+),score=45.33 TRINITY_DN10666_c0_g1_i1:154-507(+)
MNKLKEINNKVDIDENYFNFEESEEEEYIDIGFHKETEIKFSAESSDTVATEEQALLSAKSLKEEIVPGFSKLWKSNSDAFNDRRIKAEEIFRTEVPWEKKGGKWRKENSHLEDPSK